jgi:hypothetical protein
LDLASGSALADSLDSAIGLMPADFPAQLGHSVDDLTSGSLIPGLPNAIRAS